MCVTTGFRLTTENVIAPFNYPEFGPVRVMSDSKFVMHWADINPLTQLVSQSSLTKNHNTTKAAVQLVQARNSIHDRKARLHW